MCDTVVTVSADGVLFAKNSDRDPNEAQVLEWHAAAEHMPGSDVRCTWIEIPQVARTRAVLLSRPWWLWGAEIGANDAGVVIGNEAVFTKRHESEPGLVGMDLLRLALERGSSAADAVEAIVSLLERHGQGGGCSFEHPKFSYDNSFIVADPNEAYVVESAGRLTAVEAVRSGTRSISNGLTIPGFADEHADRLRSRVSDCAVRRAWSETAADGADGPAAMADVLRSHGPTAVPRYSPLNGAMRAPCLHAGGLIANAQTTASWIADLRAEPLHWVTATSAPCTSTFFPVQVDRPVDLGPVPSNVADPTTWWWQHERLHRRVMRDPAGLLPRYSAARDRLERGWFADPPDSDEAVATIATLRAGWLADVEAGPGADRRPPLVRRYWARQDRAARLDPTAVA